MPCARRPGVTTLSCWAVMVSPPLLANAPTRRGGRSITYRAPNPTPTGTSFKLQAARAPPPRCLRLAACSFPRCSASGRRLRLVPERQQLRRRERPQVEASLAGARLDGGEAEAKLVPRQAQRLLGVDAEG